MDLLYPLAGIVLLIGIPVYLHALAKLHRLIEVAEPSWLASHRAGSIFYKGMPSVVDPNVNCAVVRVAFGSRWRDLSSTMAINYVWRIRVLLPVLSSMFLGVLIAAAVDGP